MAAGRLRFYRKRVPIGHISYTVPGSPGNGLAPTAYPDIRESDAKKVIAEILRVGPFEIFYQFIT